MALIHTEVNHWLWLPCEKFLGALYDLYFTRIGLRGVNLGEDGERKFFKNPLATDLINPSVVVRSTAV